MRAKSDDARGASAHRNQLTREAERAPVKQTRCAAEL